MKPRTLFQIETDLKELEANLGPLAHKSRPHQKLRLEHQRARLYWHKNPGDVAVPILLTQDDRDVLYNVLSNSMHLLTQRGKKTAHSVMGKIVMANSIPKEKMVRCRVIDQRTGKRCNRMSPESFGITCKRCANQMAAEI